MAKASLELQFNTDGADEKVKALVASLQSLSSTAANVKGPNVSGPTSDIEKLKSGVKSTKAEADGLKHSLGGVADGLASMTRNAAGASGFAGPLAGLIGVTSIAAVLAAVGTVVGMSMKMAYEFEKSSARAAAALSIGFGGSLAGNMQKVQGAAYAGEKYGYNVQEMVAAMEAYGRTSGATVNATTAAAGGLATYARAYGLEPGRVGSMVGSFQAASGGRGSFDSNAEALFGGAEHAGGFGRRIEEFVATSTSVLQSMMYSQSGSNFDPSRAAGFTARIAREGGIYATQGGVQGVLGAGMGLVSGGDSDVRKAGLMMRAGMSSRDILLGNTGLNGKNMELVRKELVKEFGPLSTNLGIMGALGSGLSQADVRLLAGMRNPSLLMDAAGRPRSAKQIADDFEKTPAGGIAHAMAMLSNSMTADGDKLLHFGNDMLRNNDSLNNLTNATRDLWKFYTGSAKDREAKPGSTLEAKAGLSWGQQFSFQQMIDRGASPALAREYASIGASPEDAHIMHSVFGKESSNGTNAGISVDGAGGIMQMMPATAQRFLPKDWLAKHGAVGYANDDTYARQGPGWKAFMADRHIQRQASFNYIKLLEDKAWNKGFRGDAFIKAVSEGYYSGEGNVGNPNVRDLKHPDYPTSGEYGDDLVKRYHSMDGHTFEVGGVKVDIKVTHTGGAAARTRPQARHHG